MTDTVDLSTFRAKVEARKREQREKAAALAPPTTADFHDDDLVPVDTGNERSEEDKELDRIIEGVDIVSAYTRWCGKMTPKIAPGQTESIMISCPVPGHADKVPSAWINTDKQVWHCGRCEQGGDAMDLAAFSFGYPVPGYKEGARFHELRRDMAKSMGYTFHKMSDGKTYVGVPATEESDSSDKDSATGTNGDEPGHTAPPSSSSSTGNPDDESVAVVVPEDLEPSAEGTAEVIELFDDMEDVIFPALDWRSIVPKETFLDAYMECCIKDDVPEEYHFWNGLLALGLAMGRQVRLYDLVPVYGNLFICTLGHSGSGKSKARYHLDQLLQKALPYKADDPNNIGTKRVNTPASAEVLVQSFQKPVTDPANPKIVLYNAPVRGIIDFNELSALVGRANRMGNVLKPTLMQFYDMESIISTTSLTSGVKEAAQPFASALTTTQPRALRELLGRGDDSSGFLNRWVFAAGPEKVRTAIGGFRVDVTPAVMPLERVVGWAASFRDEDFIQWSEPAAQRFTDFFHSVIERDKKRSTSELVTRIDLLMKKLILLFTANRQEKIVPLEAVEEAMKCYPYIMACYSIPAEQLGNTLQSEIRDAIAYQAQEAAKRGSSGITMSEIARALKRRKYPMDLLKKVIELMVAFGELDVMIVNKGGVGRPTERFRYVG